MVVESESDKKAGHVDWRPSKAELTISLISGVFFIAEIAVCFLLYYDFYALDLIFYIGWVFLFLGIAMMSIPRFELSRKGKVAEGMGWINTTVVIDTGIYGIVRHPLYVGWIISIIAMMLISQYWVTSLLGFIPLIVVVHYAFSEERMNVNKFGQSYIEYRQRVPMMNFILGLWRSRKRNRA